MALTLNIATVDRTNQVYWPSVKKMDVLTKEPDRLEFLIKNYGSKTYRPSLGEAVELLDGSTKIFSGAITETLETNDGMAKYFSVVCKDEQYTMDRKLVNRTYTNQTAGAIIEDIKTTYLPAGFTTTNVIGTAIIPKIVFNDEQPSKCIQRLADALGEYDWYVDYDKDIHFFPEGYKPAPFNIDDTSGNYIFGSLRIEKNINQIRNSVIVRGGDRESSTLTNTNVADGQQRVFTAKPGLRNLTIEKSTTGGSSWGTLTIGTDGKDAAAGYDVLYNTNSGEIIFREDNKPASGNFVRWSGIQIYPIKITRNDPASIALYGEWQYVIRDATIKSEMAAIQRARAEIAKYSAPSTEGIFRTYRSGLRSGQTITVASSVLGIAAKQFTITRVIFTARSPSEFDYEVALLASESLGIIDVFSKLLVSDPATQFSTLEDEVLIQVQGFSEVVSFGETVRVNPFGVNVNPIWVAGPYYPTSGSDRNRAPRTDAGAKILS
jgi:hypothetical protein